MTRGIVLPRFRCRSGRHEWLHSQDADRCCNGWVSLYVPTIVAYGWGRLERVLASGDQANVQLTQDFLTELYAQKGRTDARTYASEDERSVWLSCSRRWVPDHETDKIAYIRSILPLPLLAQMDGIAETEIQ